MKYLAVLVVFATLVFAPVLAQAQSSPLNPDLLNGLLDLDARKGTDRDVPAEIANRLGLSASGEGWASRQIAGPDPEKGVLHGFAVSRGSDHDIAFSLLRQNNNIHAFRVRRDGKIVTAVIMDIQTRQFTVPSLDEAQKEVDAEFVYWARGGSTEGK